MPVEIKTTTPSLQEGIFISYRRDGSSTFSSILYYELCKYFSAGIIFKDAVTLKPGTDFKKEIEQALNHSSILLVLLDKNGHNKKMTITKKSFLKKTILYGRK